ncbi:MAG: hypothetical protein WC489_06415 [Patescibacteria group bacterium]
MNKRLTEEDKKKIYDVFADSYISLVGQGLIGRYERKIIAQYILKGVRGSETIHDIIKAAENLAKRYPQFHTALAHIKGGISDIREEQVISRLKDYITHSKHSNSS